MSLLAKSLLHHLVGRSFFILLPGRQHVLNTYCLQSTGLGARFLPYDFMCAHCLILLLEHLYSIKNDISVDIPPVTSLVIFLLFQREVVWVVRKSLQYSRSCDEFTFRFMLRDYQE